MKTKKKRDQKNLLNLVLYQSETVWFSLIAWNHDSRPLFQLLIFRFDDENRNENKIQ